MNSFVYEMIIWYGIIMTSRRNLDKKYYYVDKTEFISDVMNEKVALYTRPRRFGKTLNISMLYYFFSNKEKNRIMAT